MITLLENINRFVWGIPTLVLILGVGLYLSVRTRFAQLRLFPQAFYQFFRQFKPKESNDGISPLQALCTALAATVGTGNIAGVAGAISIGGPGAIFWMWVCAILGMVIKFAEATLAIRFRIQENGEYIGGPMYMILQGMDKKWRFLGVIYAFFGIIATFGVGNATQINALVTGYDQAIHAMGFTPSKMGDLMLGICLSLVLSVLLLGGAKRIGHIAQLLVPFGAIFYLLLGFLVLIARFQAIPAAFSLIFRSAFSPQAITGGVVGSMLTTLRIGVSRGVFTNEAGMGTASIAHAGAQVSHPCQQGLMGIMEVFLDTIVICTMTALVILVSGVPIPYGTDPGASLTTQAFQSVCGNWASIPIAFCLALFAFATVLGWGLYGARCAQFLFGPDVWRKFVFFQAIAVICGAAINTSTIWMLCETVNGLMAIPNLIALAALSPELCRLTIHYGGINHESFHQRKPLRTFSHAKIPSPGHQG